MSPQPWHDVVLVMLTKNLCPSKLNLLNFDQVHGQCSQPRSAYDAFGTVHKVVFAFCTVSEFPCSPMV